jgi:CRP/FNR family cyclic AMP-dependent transcriptional regulator
MAISKNESAFINSINNDFVNTLFANMPDYVKMDASIESIGKEQAIVRTSYPVNDAFVILKGELIVINEFESGKIYEPVSIFENDFVGVVEVVLEQEEFISTVSAVEKVTYIRIPKKTFIRWIQENGIVSYMVLKSVSNNFSINMTNAGEQIVLDSMYLLVNHIIKNATYKSDNNLYVLIESRDKSAKRTGINIRTLYRYIKQLKSLNYISLHNKRIAFNEAQKNQLINYSVYLRNK